MRYIGSKASSVMQIACAIQAERHDYSSLCDPFAGTCTVARYFKTLGLRVVTGDLLRQSYIFQTVYVQLSRPPAFGRLLAGLKRINIESADTPALAVLGYLNDLPGRKGFISRHYSPEGHRCRQFFTSANARRIDHVWYALDCWKEDRLIDHDEEAYLLAALLEGADRVANTAGTYYAYLKTFYRKALKKFRLGEPSVFGNNRRNLANQIDALDLVKKTRADVLYLDPPYNDRDYGAYYHLTETLALRNKPRVKGISGIPTGRSFRSAFCNRETAMTALEGIVSAARARCLAIHYSPNGLVPHSAIMRLLRDRGPTTWSAIPVRRYSSHHGDSSTETACTRLYICRVR